MDIESAGTPDNEPNGSELGWGLDVSTNLRTIDRDRVILSVVYGEGIASYMNDGGVDLAPDGTPTDPDAVCRCLGWSPTTTITGATRSAARSATAAPKFKKGQYASANVIYYPGKNMLVGAELLWGRREDRTLDEDEDPLVDFIAVVSPPLDAAGNGVRAQKVILTFSATYLSLSLPLST